MNFATLLTAILISSSMHGYIGVQRAGNSIEHVAKDSPADKAGIKVHDRVLLIDGRKSGQIDGPAGEVVELDIKRGEQMLHFDIQRVTHDEAYKAK